MKQEETYRKELSKTIHKQTLWALTFTKKLVIVIVTFFILATGYVAVAMWKFNEFSYLGTVYESICGLVQVVAFGYLLKAGLENVPKILFGDKRLKLKEDSEESDPVG